MKIKKRILSVLLVILTAFTVIPYTALGVSAEKYSGKCGEDLVWEYDDFTRVLSITGTGAMWDFNYENTAPWDGFSSFIAKVRIGNQATTIGDEAFRSCGNMTGVSIGSGVVSIGDMAFGHCSALTSLTLPDGVKSVGDMAFYACSALKSVALPSGLVDLGKDVFMQCEGLTEIKVDKNNSFFSSVDGILYNKNKTELYVYPAAKQGTSFTVPDSVVIIGSYAFNYCKNLTKISVGDNVLTIDEYAFVKCKNLTDVTIGKGVKEISPYTFAWCESLTGFTVPDGVTSIGNYAFQYCKNLTKVSIPKSVTKIGIYVLDDSPKLKYVYYSGTADEWNAIDIDSNDVLNNTVIVCDPFTDVPHGKWFTEGALWCAYKGYMTGTADTAFSPNADFTRAMFVTVLAKIDGADTSGYIGSSFVDVPHGKWYSKPIQWAFKNGYASGVGGGKFGPNNPVTREQLSQFLYNYTQKKGWETSASADISGYPDAGKVANYAKNAVAWAVGYGMISGVKTDGSVFILPQGTAARAQVAVIVKNFVEKFAE